MKKSPPKNVSDIKSVDLDIAKKNLIDKFSKELSDLLKKHDIKEYAGIFMVQEKPIISYFPDDITATKLLKHAHAVCRNNVLERIGG